MTGLTRVEEVEHENSLLEKRHADDEEVETFTEEIIYYSPHKSGHYTSKEVNPL